MLTQHSELFAPSLHYQQAITAESRRMAKPVSGPAMAPEIKEHLECMLLQAASEQDRQPANLLLQYCTGFIGHAVFSSQCTMEERNHYWGRIDKIRQDVADRVYARTGK